VVLSSNPIRGAPAPSQTVRIPSCRVSVFPDCHCFAGYGSNLLMLSVGVVSSYDQLLHASPVLFCLVRIAHFQGLFSH